MTHHTSYIDHVRELMSGLGAIQTRRMFGGYGVYHDGIMIGLVAEERLYLKVDADTQARFGAAGSEPFVYQGAGKRVQTSYWSAPEEALDAPHLMLSWARLAYAAALRKAATKKPVRSRKPAGP